MQANTEYIEEVQITDDGGVVKKIISHGDAGVKPEKCQKVSVQYEGRLEDGTVFDSSLTRGAPLEFQVGMGQVIKAWDEGICQLKKGSKAILTCPPEYAYGP